VSTPTLVCDRDIAPNDTFAEMFDEAQPVFSATTVRDFLDLHKDATDIILEVRSDGGSTSEARIIYDMLKGCGKTITTHGYKVNSSAMILFLAGENRLISQNSDSIIHPVWVDAFGLPWQLEAQDLRMFANEIEAEQVKLVDIYCSVIGEDKRVEVSQLMAQTTNLTSDESVRLGFATGKLVTKEKSENSNRSVVYTNKMFAAAMLNKKNQNQMAAKEESRIDKVLETMSNMAKAFVTKNETPEGDVEVETVNASAELAEGGSVYFDGELAEGTALFSDEAMESPIADGEFAMADGRSVMVAGGVVTELVAVAEDDAPDEENKEVAALNAKIKELENSNKAILENQEKQTDALSNLTDMLGTMKNLVVGDPVKKNVVRRDAPKDYNNMTNFEKLKYNRDNK
jgi:ATP-dependent protease ClpP protease subunit